MKKKVGKRKKKKIGGKVSEEENNWGKSKAGKKIKNPLVQDLPYPYAPTQKDQNM